MEPRTAADSLARRWDEVRALRDDLRVRIHLAGMNARDAWNRLEPRLRALELQVERTSETAMEELSRAVDDARVALERLRKDVVARDDAHRRV